jgi:hypothetical protein
MEALITIDYHCRGSDDEDSSSNVPELLSYHIQNWTSSSMTFKLMFSKPLYVSTFGSLDFVTITILQRALFMSKLDKFMVADLYSLTTDVPAQMASEADFIQIQSMGSSSSNALLLTLIVPFCFMIFMSFSMNKVWVLYNMMQLIINIKNYKALMIPANLMLMLEIVTNIVTFSIFENRFV